MNIFRTVCKDDVVIDCGAYVGRISHYFADKGAKVYAFEPFPILCDGLEKRFKEYPNVTVVRKGAYNRNCKLKLFYHTEYMKVDEEHKVKYLESSSIYPQKRNVGKKYFLADVVDLAKFIKKLNCDVKLLKLNVEGSEYKILNRLIDTGVIYNIELIVVAFHNKNIDGLQKEHELLKAKAIEEDVYDNIIRWKWWRNNSKFLMKIRKEYSL